MGIMTASARAAKPRFPFFDLQVQFASIREEVMQAVEAVFDSQQFIQGPQVEILEKEISAHVNAPFAVACASGTDALYLALLAQGIGATYRGEKVGSIGDFGCFSFFPSKNLGCAGDGGMVTTRDREMAERLRLLRAHGSRAKYHSEIIGTNSRLDTLQAAILSVKLRHLDTWTKARRERAKIYQQLFADRNLGDAITLPTAPPDYKPFYNQYVILSN